MSENTPRQQRVRITNAFQIHIILSSPCPAAVCHPSPAHLHSAELHVASSRAESRIAQRHRLHINGSTSSQPPQRKDSPRASIQLHREGFRNAVPVETGLPKSGDPSAFHENRCARGDRLAPHPCPDPGFAW